MRRPFVHLTILLALASWWIPSAAWAQEHVSVTSCPRQSNLPVTFEIDCTHLSDANSRNLCGPFLQNQACRIFPAYRKITGINLEDKCKSIKFTIYQDDNWPHPKGEGGLALNCAVDYLEQYSVKFRADSSFGPYDVHELLHEYQLLLGALPSTHPLFGPSMAEAMKEIGDTQEYNKRLQNMRGEVARLGTDLQAGKYDSDPRGCMIAQTYVEESLYLENPQAVYAYYRKVTPDTRRDPAVRNARFNRMFYVVSGPKEEVKQLLTQHCGKF